MRLPDFSDDHVLPADGTLVADGVLYFGDGSMRGVAGGIVWLGLLYIFKKGCATVEYSHPQVVQLISSLLRIPTVYKTMESNMSKADSAILRIIRQNQAAKTEPVTSFQWASILRSIADDTVVDTDMNFASLMDMYNMHPEVAALTADDDQDKTSGTGSIALSGKMKVAVRNWLERCSDAAWNEVMKSQHDFPFNLGPFGEVFATNFRCFADSVVATHTADSTCDLVPMQSETYILIDWKLPLTGYAQTLLTKRMRHDFAGQTSCVPIASKKKYRKVGDELQSLCNCMALWVQLKPHVETKLPAHEVAAWEHALTIGNVKDDDLTYILEARPAMLSLGMLPSQRELAQRAVSDRDQSICVEVESQRLDVRNAKFNYLKTALERDHLTITTAKGLPAKVKIMEHRKGVQARQKQAEKGERAVLGYCNKYLKTIYISKPELAQTEVVTSRSAVVA